MIRPPQDDIEEMEEEAAANNANAPARTGKKMAARPGQRSRCFSQSFLPIAVCWLILLVIMGLRIYFTSRNLNNSVFEKPITNLTALNQELETRNQELETRNQDLETQNQELETQNQELETQNQELEMETKNLTGPMQNISRAQWSIDEYCPKVALHLYSWYRPWIGLRAEGGRWKWIDGSDLTESLDLNIIFFPQCQQMETRSTSN
ncbi:uncharacterized protein LOC116675107 [Etheostoma spectabile]|uniref:uncharacterized protein LOC116675107 n=1 Tax=Etheostoma spectabile TaxID=54343 RepID=UPI0013AEC175|nr:uncharacterized protein LOC116675107 [Etheostoma spectabile]